MFTNLFQITFLNIYIISPATWIHTYFYVTVDEIGEHENTANVTAYDTCCDSLWAEDNATVIGIDAQCPGDMDVTKVGRYIEDTEWVKDIDVYNQYDLVEFNITIHNNETCCNLTNISVSDYFDPGLMYYNDTTYFMHIYIDDTLLIDGVDYTFEQQGNNIWWNFTELVELQFCHSIGIYFFVEIIDYGDWMNSVDVLSYCDDAILEESDEAYVHLMQPE